MAIEIGPIAKPHIWLEGNVTGDANRSHGNYQGWFGRVDHALVEPVTSLTSISAVTNFDDQNILTFDSTVRIVILGMVDPKPDFWTENNIPTGGQIFEGGPTGIRDNENAVSVSESALTYFTINGKDPVRTKSYLYKYRDFGDVNSTNLDANGIPERNEDFQRIGFILGSCQTGRAELLSLSSR